MWLNFFMSSGRGGAKKIVSRKCLLILTKFYIFEKKYAPDVYQKTVGAVLLYLKGCCSVNLMAPTGVELKITGTNEMAGSG